MDADREQLSTRMGTGRPHHLMRDLENHPTHTTIEVSGNWVMKQAGIRGSGEASARSWLNWGQ
jgi:hypothetical protein